MRQAAAAKMHREMISKPMLYAWSPMKFRACCVIDGAGLANHSRARNGTTAVNCGKYIRRMCGDAREKDKSFSVALSSFR